MSVQLAGSQTEESLAMSQTYIDAIMILAGHSL